MRILRWCVSVALCVWINSFSSVSRSQTLMAPCIWPASYSYGYLQSIIVTSSAETERRPSRRLATVVGVKDLKSVCFPLTQGNAQCSFDAQNISVVSSRYNSSILCVCVALENDRLGDMSLLHGHGRFVDGVSFSSEQFSREGSVEENSSFGKYSLFDVHFGFWRTLKTSKVALLEDTSFCKRFENDWLESCSSVVIGLSSSEPNPLSFDSSASSKLRVTLMLVGNIQSLSDIKSTKVWLAIFMTGIIKSCSACQRNETILMKYLIEQVYL